MRRTRSPAPSPFRALAHHQQAVAGHGGLMRAFEVDTNPSRPMRPSPLTASNIRDMPLELFDRIRTFPLFASAPDDFLAAVLSHVRPQVHAMHDHIVTEGDEAKAMYWLVRGVVAVTSRDGEAVYAELKPGAFFGEIGVLMNIPRTATIVARTKCLLVVLMKENLLAELPKYPDMEKAIMHEAQERLSVLKKKRSEGGQPKSPPDATTPLRDPPGEVATGEVGAIREGGTIINSRKRKSPSPGIVEDPMASGSVLGSGLVNIRKTLLELPLFAKLPPDILHFLGLSAQPKTYPPFTNIVRQGNPGNEIFFIVRGEAEVIHDEPVEGRGSTAPLPRLKQGQYFGEISSLGLSPGRTATVRSITAVECLMIGGDALDELWARCPPEFRSEVLETARKRYKKLEGDVAMIGSEVSPPVTPKELGLPRMAFTSPSIPVAPAREDVQTRTDPDPFLSVDMENLRNRRRNSLAPAPGTDSAPNIVNGHKQTAPFESSPIRFSITPADVECDVPAKRQRTLAHRPRTPQQAVLDDDLLIAVFQYLELTDLLRLRIICPVWRQLLSTSPKLCGHVDLSIYNRKVTDKAIATILGPFIGTRPVLIDISNCFHITDEGFSSLWRQCGKNVKHWYMRSVWDVSANQILEMSENAKGLEEVDWSNCRKVGDNLLARVVGWVVPEPLPPSKTLMSQSPHPTAKARRGVVLHRQPTRPVNMPAPGTVIGCPGLSRLNLSYCKHITDRSMAHLAAHASTRLRSLTLTRCTSITDAGFQTWTSFQFPYLQQLCLADCTYLTDNAIIALVNGAKQLTHLDLSFCCALSDTATQVVALGLPKLKELRLAFCGSAVSDTSLGGVALHLNELERISVRGCVRVTGGGVEGLLHGCGRLEWMDISQCNNVAGWLRSGGVARWGVDDRGPSDEDSKIGGVQHGLQESAVLRPSPVPGEDGQETMVGNGGMCGNRMFSTRPRRARKAIYFVVEKGTDGLR